MWHDACSFAKQNKWIQFEFISNPYAVQFYCRMGAEIIADYGSAKEGMKIMSYRL